MDDLKLSRIMIDWLEEKKYNITIYESRNKPGTWFIDLHVDGNYFTPTVAMAAIIDNAHSPYVVLLNTKMRPMTYYHPAEPDFFEKIEAHIKYFIEAHGQREN